MQSLQLLLLDIRSVHNVASIFRTADGAGVEKIILSGYSPTPTDRFGRARKDFHKVALGAENTVAWEEERSVEQAIERARAEGREILVLEQSERSIALAEARLTRPALLIVGNETEGVSEAVQALADTIIEIPMRGEKESLNVSVASGIALYQLLK